MVSSAKHLYQLYCSVAVNDAFSALSFALIRDEGLIATLE